MAGETLADGRYHLLEVLGEGGMAKVWCAFDERLQVHRAIKVLLPAFANRTMIRQRFLNEARTMARLHHPNIVAVHDVVEDEAVPYMVMELVRGGSLADYLEAHGPMHPRLAAQATLAVLAALELAHDEGVIHRDIKPQNILVTAKGKPKVTDFGIARLTGPNDGSPALTRTGSTLGTWGFMAPEQRSSARQADARADVYAVGATLYSLVTNEIPVDLFTAELDDTRITGIPEPLEPIIRKACRYHVHDRYDGCAEMAEALREALPAMAELELDTPELGGSLGALPTPEERQAAQDIGGNNETLMPPPNTFRLEDSDLPPISRPDPSDADQGGTGLTRLDTPEPEDDRGRVAMFAGGAVAALLLMLWVLWPSEAEVTELPVDVVEPIEVTENPSPEIEPPVLTPTEDAEPDAPEAPQPTEAAPSPAVQTPSTGGAGGAKTPKEPAVEAPGEVEPEEAPPEEAPPPVVPDPPKPARIQVTGDAASVVFIGSNGQVQTSGEVPADSYTIKASFGDGALAPAGKVTVAEGQAVTLHCSASFASCKPQ